jgi:hypothetical protein
VRRARVALACAAALLLVLAPAAAAARPMRSVVVAFVPSGDGLAGLHDGAAQAIGLMTGSVGNFDAEQTWLDITQGARVPGVDYSPRRVGALSLAGVAPVRGWRAVQRRAASADAAIEPGLLASAIPGGAAFVGGAQGEMWLLAADRAGRVNRGASVARELAAHHLVVVELASVAELRALLARRVAGELVVAIARPPYRVGAPLLLPIGVSGLGRGALSSGATRTAGLVAATDLAPTILRWLRLPVPGAMNGQAIVAGHGPSVGALSAYAARLAVVGGRRVLVLGWFGAVWLALVLAGALRGRGARAALRLGGLVALWAPLCALVAALVRPDATDEVLIVVGGAFALARASVAWPRAGAVVGGLTVVVCVADLLAGSGLVEQSLLGSDPIAGSRFFGAGNELTAILAVELIVALRGFGVRALLVLGGLVTLLLAWDRGGANVGAVFTVGGAVAGTALALGSGRLTARRVAIAGAALAGVLGLVVVLDLASGGGGQLVGAHSVWQALGVARRRLFEAWLVLRSPAVALAVAVALAGSLVAIVARERRDGAWVVGLLCGGLLGSLAADSGPRVLLIIVAGMGCAVAYLQDGRPVLTSRLALVRRLVVGSGFPRPDPPNLMSR